ncbi:MAG: ABC transporter ATP-binding protein [Lachnospiraceae bacterium]|nr:ABC transporter ATP-binding protein [Lachnospiraceae bacterium]
MKKYMETVRRIPYAFVLGPLFMMLEASGEFILPYMMADIINIGAAGHDTAFILRQGALMAVMALFMLIFGVAGAWFAIRAATSLAADLRFKTYQKIQTFSFSQIDDFSTGSFITRITNDVTQIQNFAQQLLRGAFRSPIMLVGAFVMSMIMDFRLALILFVVVPLLGFAIYLIIRIASPRYTAMQEALDSLNNYISETITNEYVIKSFASEDYEKGRFGAVNGGLITKSLSALRMMLFLQPAITLAVSLSTLAAVWIAGQQIMVGSMAVGTLAAFITYLSQVLTSLQFLANIFLTGTRAAASDRRISQVLETRADLTDASAREKDKTIEKGAVAFRDLTFRYFKEDPRPVLDHVSLEILPGQMVGIVGSTGSGKSTLISMIPRLYDPDSGAVLVDGTDVRDLSLSRLREAVAVVLQKNTLFSGTIAENLRWGKEEASMEEIRRSCRIACADSFIEEMPLGYDTELEQGGRNLSGGQRQRLCLARAILRNPRILILDDSTSAVDTATDAKIRRALARDLPGMTRIVIAQRIGSVMDADQIIVMEEGRIAGCGTHEELMKTCRPYREIWYSQKDKEETP